MQLGTAPIPASALIGPLPRPIPISLETAAVNYFSASFASTSKPGYTHTMPGYLATFEVLYPLESQGSLLQITGEAVGLAALGIHLKDENVLLRSRGQYARALKLAREAFCTPLSPPSNATILAVLLFGLYEVSERLGVPY